MSFLKYQDAKEVVEGNGRGPLSFSRAHLDGMPFRGTPAMLKEEEHQEFCETVHDAHVDIFDVGDPKQKKELTLIVDRAANGWYKILRMSEQWGKNKDGLDTVKVYIIWTEPHKEINKQRLPTGSL
jgi:hypothetical protein